MKNKRCFSKSSKGNLQKNFCQIKVFSPKVCWCWVLVTYLNIVQASTKLIRGARIPTDILFRCLIVGLSLLCNERCPFLFIQIQEAIGETDSYFPITQEQMIFHFSPSFKLYKYIIFSFKVLNSAENFRYYIPFPELRTMAMIKFDEVDIKCTTKSPIENIFKF